MTLNLQLRQSTSPDNCPVTTAVDELAQGGSVEERGAVFTRREVVDFILDLVGYQVDQPLHKLRLLEPSFGGGDFLLPVLDRLLAAWKKVGDSASAIDELRDCIRGVELHQATFEKTQKLVTARLRREGIERDEAEALTREWLSNGDFLLSEWSHDFDVVVGNPPYVRQEMIPSALVAEYRKRYATIYDRADLYVPFMERSLHLLKNRGVLGFICADRWMKNRYGGPLRAFVADGFRLRVHVDMTDTLAFHSDVIAYPAITIISRERSGTTRLASRPKIESSALTRLAVELRSIDLPEAGNVREISNVAEGSEPWILESPDHLALVRRLERKFPSIEDAGCKVGIGVATGADKAFIGPMDSLDVEDDRKEPLVMTKDIQSGSVSWRGLGVINPFSTSGGLVDLGEYPRLRRYLEARKAEIAGRHCAKKSPENWYRTIDRITPALTKKPKLLIPDIKGEAHVVYEEGRLYPHHNLYFVTSDEWDLRALQAVLMSGVARLFVATYSTRMRGGFLRFQAQYLRRIRVPMWSDVPSTLRERLIGAAIERDISACNRASIDLYGISAQEAMSLGGDSERQD